MVGQEPYGTTPFPIPLDERHDKGVLEVCFDPTQALEIAQQPQSQQIALFDAPPCDDYINGSRLDVNQHFVVYAVKNGLIRVLHRHSAIRTLLRGHEGQRVTDIAFFHDGDVLGTVGFAPQVGGASSVIIWRVYERSSEIMSERLLEIPTTKFSINRMIFHPFNPNQFWMIHTSDNSVKSKSEVDALHVATLVDTTRITTVPHENHQHLVCQFYNDFAVMEGAKQVAVPDGGLTDLAWSDRDPRHVMTAHQNGQIILWDLKNVDHNSSLDSGLLRPERLTTLYEVEGVSRCLFLPHDDIVRPAAAAATNNPASAATRAWTTCFCTATQNNGCFTIWSPFSENAIPTKLHKIAFKNPSPSYLLAVCFGPSPADALPPSSFVVLADRSKGNLFAFHIKSKWNEQPGESKQTLAAGCDYVVPFSTKYPIFSWAILCAPTTDISEEELSEQGGLIFDMKLFSYQSQVVQALTLTSYMCLPPETSWTGAAPGVSAVVTIPAEDFEGAETEKPVVYDEVYEIDDDVEEVEDDFPEGPAASSLPPPIGFGARNNGERDLVDSSNGTTNAALATINNNNAFANWLGAIAGKSSDFNGTTNTGATATTGGAGVAPAPGLFAKRQPPDSGFSPRERLPPPPPPPTPANAAIKALSTLSNIPTLPGIEDPAIVGITSSRQLSSPFLSPVDMLARSSGISDDKIPPTTGSAPESPSDIKKKSKPGKKEKSKPHNAPKTTSAAAMPAADGKIFILKRGEENALPMVVSSGVTPAAAPAAVPSAPLAAPVDFEEILNRVLTSHSKKQHAFLVSEIQKTVRTEMETTVVPALSKAVQQSMDQSIFAPLKADLAKMKKSVRDHKEEMVEAVMAGVEEPLQAAFVESMKNILIPAFESVTTRMFSQIATTMDDNLSSNNNSKKDLEELTANFTNMASAVEKLSSQMEELRSMVAAQGSGERKPPGLAGNNQVDKMQSTRDEILKLLGQRQYEAAFIQALSASTADMAVFCCEHVQITDVLGNEKPALSQPILLCLMQQLGAALVSSTTSQKLQLEVLWLQEIALILDPSDRKIQQHVPNVLNELVTNISKKMANGDQSLRRPLEVLLRVIRGMQMG